MKIHQSHAFITAHLKGGHKGIYAPVTGNCVKKIEEFYDKHPELCEEGLTPTLKVYHDPWCMVHKTDVCNCDCDVELDDPESGEVC